MTKSPVRKQLLLKSAIALSFALAPAMMPVDAQANATVNVPGPGNTDVNTTNAVTSYIVTGNASLSVTNPGTITGETNHSAVDLGGFTLSSLVVNAADNTAGIASGGVGFSAIDASAAGSRLQQLTLNTGLITSADTTADTATILLGGSASSQTITTAAGTVINDTGAGGVAIGTLAANTTNTALTISNAGSINSTAAAGNIAINLVDTDGGSSLLLGNTGAIAASANTSTAIKIGAGSGTANTATITNNTGGTITGQVVGLGSSTINYTNEGTAHQNGAVNTVDGSLTVTNQDTATWAGAVSSSGAGAVSVTNKNGATWTSGNISATTGSLTVNSSSTVNMGSNITGGSALTTINQSGTGGITGNIDLGTYSNSTGSTLNITHGAITGNVTMHDATQKTILGSDVGGGVDVTGTISGAGILEIAANATQGGIIGGTPLTSIVVDASKTFTGDGSAISATTLTLNGKFVGAAGLLTANTVLGSGGEIDLGSGGYSGTIIGSSSGNGAVVFTANQTTGGDIGGTKVASVTVNDGVTVTDNNNITATAVNIGTTNSGELDLGAGHTITGNVNLAGASSKLSVNTTGSSAGVAGTINGGGILAITGGAGAFTQNGTIGQGTGLASITVASGSTLNLNAATKATTLQTTGTTNQTAGAFTGNLDIKNGGVYDYKGGTISGTVRSTDATGGTFDVDSNYTDSTGTIGANGNTVAVNVGPNTSSTLTLNNDIWGNTTLTSGKIDFTGAGVGTSRTIHGNLTVAAGSGNTLVLGNATQNVTGNLTTGAANNINSSITSVTGGNTFAAVGNLNVSGSTAGVSADKLNLTIASNAGFIANNAHFDIVAGTAGTPTNLSSISINGGTNSTQVLTATSKIVGSDIEVDFARTAFNQIAGTTSNQAAVGAAIVAIDGAATGNLSTLESYLDNANLGSQVHNALESATPQADNGITEGIYHVTSAALDVVDRRMANASGTPSSGDATPGRSVWAEGFGSSQNQDNRDGAIGYSADTYGAMIGGDKQINSTTRIGLSADYARTNIDSNVSSKSTDVDTYQANIYAAKDLGKFYVDGTAGFAWNNYSSERRITAVPAKATADFDGQTYLARIGGGYRYQTSNGIDIVPTATLTYAHEEIGAYTEQGAGTLNLKVNNDSVDVLEPRVGVKAGYTFSRPNSSMKIRPELRASYGYDLIGDNQVTTSKFSGTGVSFKTQGSDIEQGSLSVGGGINLMCRSNLTVSADYDYAVKKDYDSNSGMLRVKYDF